MKPKRKGELSEAKVLARLKELGYTVLLPWGDSERYDLVIETGGSFYTVQVKTARVKRSGTITFSCESVNWNTKESRSYRDEVDLFAVYSPDLKRSFLVPVEDAGETKMTLRYSVPNNNQRKGIDWAVDYLI